MSHSNNPYPEVVAQIIKLSDTISACDETIAEIKTMIARYNSRVDVLISQRAKAHLVGSVLSATRIV
jgi:hypothetical protein